MSSENLANKGLDIDKLGETLLELLEGNIEKSDIKIMKRREGRGYGYYIRIPAKWAEKLGLKELKESSIEVPALADFKNRAITIKIPDAANEQA